MLNIRMHILSAVLVVGLAFGTASVMAAPSTNFNGSPAASRNSAGLIGCDRYLALGVDGGALSLLSARDDPASSAATINKTTPQAVGIEGGALSLLTARDEAGTNPVAAILNSRSYSLHMIYNQADSYLAYLPTGCA